MKSKHPLLRHRAGRGHARVTSIELFFDLVFVFAITQLSHTLLEHLDPLGLLQTAMLFLAVWWAWIYTSWVTNWLDPERVPVRLALMVLMLAGLVLSTSVPQAFAEKGLAFAGAYVFMQVGRSLFMLWALGDANPSNTRNFQRITAWLALSGVFWIAGGLSDSEARLALWAVALTLDYVSPTLGFWVPGLGRSRVEDWDVEGGHMAERCSLFVIIALGESILVTGATFAGAPASAGTVTAFVLAFLSSVLMWWIYFDTGAEAGSRRIAAADDPGRIARVAYTYVHLLIVGGIIVSAVSDELVLAHPEGHTDVKTAATIIGGFLLFLIGNLLFKWIVADRMPLSHLVGLGLLLVTAPAAMVLSPLAFGAMNVAIMATVAAWETLSRRRSRSRRNEPA